MKNIALIDFDSKIPNLALMKLSTHFKEQGDNVNLIRSEYSAYSKKKKQLVFDATNYDEVHASVIFTSNKGLLKVVNCNNVVLGGDR